MQYFGSNIVGGVAESWVEAEMSWAGLDGAGWRWADGLVIPNIKSQNKSVKNIDDNANSSNDRSNKGYNEI